MVKLFDKDITKGVISNFLFWLIYSVIAGVISYYTANSAHIHGIPLYKAIPFGAVVFLFLALAANLFSLIVIRHKGGTSQKYASIKNLIDQRDGAQRASETYRGNAERLKSELEAIKPEYTSLHNIANYQKKRLQKFVLVENCIIDTSHLSEGELFIDFTFSVFNLSVFIVSISMSAFAVMEGSIFFRGKPLNREAKLFEIQVNHMNPTDRGHFTIRQWVNADEAKDIPETLKTSGNLFDFSKATVYIKSDEYPDEKAVKLDLTHAMQNAELENKLVQLGNENIWLRQEVTLWHDRISKIEELTRTLGMFYLAYNQLEQGEQLSRNTANNLKGRFAQALNYCFHDNKVVDGYYDNVPAFPDSISEQKNWIDSQCASLRNLIEEQKEGLSNYAKNNG